ncbi:PREDICTED: ubiquitin-associated and SH3 domain-containing protein A isoform X2 [Thamnophis sirtalis]|uniref:Ubiquitin-associated and SH3 domain-containing protein A isoform X2 n=1 Tax=Thamnophis sirtalis TaxID=35019 RepID=A0A6I9YXC3_9SAUR|nr:PREDICTED: ubiquitin-associated and SH3 domain-containing protein A isoform X2 [Thamnophis sirtalis]
MAAAETQLYSKVLNKRKNRSTNSLLEPLLATGFSVHVALKALAATGQKTAEAAIQWLHSHCNDPSLEDPIPQEYALYLCPTGPLNDILLEFWRESKCQCGKNKAHENFPHITLSDFFTCEDQKVDGLYQALEKAGSQFSSSFPVMISLSLHSSSTYIGFFLSDGPENVIKSFAAAFAAEATVLAGNNNPEVMMSTGTSREADCCVKPSIKQLHLTLAHKFYPHHQKTLEQLAKSINPKQSCQWVAALYSRDMRFVHYQGILYMLIGHSNMKYVMDGQLVYLTKLDAGDFSLKITQKKPMSQIPGLNTDAGQHPKNQIKTCFKTKIPSPVPRNVAKMLAHQLSTQTTTQRDMLVICHGERVDQVFGKSWVQQCFAPDGKYYRRDLNFPSSLPNQDDYIKRYKYDPPLSCCGTFQSRLTGEALLEKEVFVGCVYSSPALYCIQTAYHLIEGLRIEQKAKIRIEPGLFEWTKWEASTTAPSFTTEEELNELGYSIDTTYKCHFPSSSLIPSESYEDYINRCSSSIKQISDTCSSKGTILIIAHCSSLDSLPRPLLGLPARESSEFAKFVQRVPSLAMCFCKEMKEEKRWQMVNPPVEMLTHGANIAFNWKHIILDN